MLCMHVGGKSAVTQRRDVTALRPILTDVGTPARYQTIFHACARPPRNRSAGAAGTARGATRRGVRDGQTSSAEGIPYGPSGNRRDSSFARRSNVRGTIRSDYYRRLGTEVTTTCDLRKRPGATLHSLARFEKIAGGIVEIGIPFFF